MVNRRWQLFLSGLVISLAGMLTSASSFAVEPMKAEEPLYKPEVERKDVKLARIDTESLEIGYYAGSMTFEDFGTNSVQGVFLAFHVNEDVFLQGNYAETTIGKASSEVINNSPMFTDKERDVTYYNVLLGYNLLPGEVYVGSKLAFDTDLYIVVGSGTTRFAGDDYATFVYGWGYRFLGADWLSIHLDVRNYSFTHYKFGYEKSVNNLETSIGLAIFF